MTDPDPNLIAEVFRMDALKRTREDKSMLVEHFRKNRGLWVQAGKPTGRLPKKPAPAGGIKLEDLDL